MEQKLSEKIYKKDFKHQSIGYDVREVDAYLDEINVEVIRLEKALSDANEKIKRLEMSNNIEKRKVDELTKNVNSLKANNTTADRTFNGNTNLDILKRLSNIEKMVSTLIEKK